MRILIDECLPKKLKHELKNHHVITVQEKGWNDKTNGELLNIAEKKFDVWLTSDQNIESQQNLNRFNIAVVVLVAHRNSLESLQPLIPELLEVLQMIQPKQIIYINS